MPLELYKDLKFSRRSLAIIDRANALLSQYAADGFQITLRTLYYRFVARGWLPNKQKSYKRLGKIIGRGRLAGRIDWEHIEDRMRGLVGLRHYDGVDQALNELAESYGTDLWARQEYRPEVWIEKDALTGVISRVCHENDVPYFCCRGYTSLSEMWRASERLKYWITREQKPYIIHFGDHDPSGIDMSRDIVERIQETFMSDCEFKRVALNMDQIEAMNPPPNPAKISDSRYKAYVAKYGENSWELDALEPAEFATIIGSELKGLRNEKLWKEDVKAREQVRERLVKVAERWEEIGGIDTMKGRISRLESLVKRLRRKKKGK